MDNGSPRVAGVLIGDIDRDREVRIKLAPLFAALGARLPLAGLHDVNLHGMVRLLVALRSFRLGRRRWSRRFHKNLAAFRGRSRRASALVRADGRADVLLQIGGMFDARWRSPSPPSVIYTDYTARLSARHPEAGRSPLSARELQRWLELEGRAYRRAAHVCTRSEFVRDNLVTQYGLAADSVTAVGGGVNFDPLPDARHDASATGSTDGPTALFVGKHLHRKGGDLLLRAFARARRRVPTARLVLVTSDSSPAGLPLDGVTVLAPIWDRDRLSALYAEADLFVLPSRLETWGDVLLEAMAHGLPCLGVDGEAMTEIISPGVTGSLVPGEDAEALAVALADLLSDRARLRRWGANARERVESSFTWQRVAERLAPILEEAAAGRGTGR